MAGDEAPKSNLLIVSESSQKQMAVAKMQNPAAKGMQIVFLSIHIFCRQKLAVFSIWIVTNLKCCLMWCELRLIVLLEWTQTKMRDGRANKYFLHLGKQNTRSVLQVFLSWTASWRNVGSGSHLVQLIFGIQKFPSLDSKIFQVWTFSSKTYTNIWRKSVKPSLFYRSLQLTAESFRNISTIIYIPSSKVKGN